MARTNAMRRTARAFAIPILLCTGLVVSAFAGTTVSTFSAWDGSTAAFPVGTSGGSDTYGQTFMAPAGSPFLTNFSFWVGWNYGDTVAFTGYLMAWNGTEATGAVLFQSSTAVTVDSSTQGIQKISFAVPNVNLTPGQTYVFFLVADSPSGGPATAVAAVTGNSASYSSGNFVFSDSGGVVANLTGSAWLQTDSASAWGDAVFEADFNSSASGGALSFTCSLTTGPTAVGTAYATTCTATGGTQPYTFDSQGMIPAGLTLTKAATTETLSGIPTAAGSFNYALGVADSGNPPQNTGTVFTGTIAAAGALSFTCSPTTGPTTVGVAYTTTCTATGGIQPYTFDSQGTIPPGLTLTKAATTQTLSGIPTAAGSFNYALGVADSGNPPQNTGTVFTGTIAAAAALSFTCSPTIGPTSVGVAYTATCTAVGGTQPYTFDSQGTIPPGLTLTKAATTVTLSGTPTTAGAFNYSLGVSDSEAPSKSAGTTFTGTIAAAGGTPLSFTCSPATGPVTAGVAYSTTCTAAGGIPPYSFSTAGALPPGLTAAATGAATATISGTPTTAGAYSYSYAVGDSETPLRTASVSFTGTIAAAGSPTATPAGFVSAASFQGANGTGVVSPGGMYSVFGSNLGPAQFAINAPLIPGGQLATTLAGVTIKFDGVPAPLFLSTAAQLNFQAPFELSGKSSTQVVIAYNGLQSSPITVPVATEQPAFFTVTPGGQDSIGVNVDGTLNTSYSPSARGSGNVVTFYGTGLGQPSYTIVTGAASPAPPSGYTGNYTCTVGTIVTNAAYAGYTPTTVGLAQFNISIPANAPAGTVTLTCTSPGGASTQQGTVYLK